MTPQKTTRRQLLSGSATALSALSALPILAQTARAQSGSDTPSTRLKGAITSSTPLAAALPAGDLEIVRFALTLERLEAAFYSQVLSAHNTRAYLGEHLLAHVRAIAAAETSHVQALEAVLSGSGEALPAAQNFKFPANVFVSPLGFAWFGSTLEEIGVRAYLGAAPKIKTASLLKSAAAIYGAEARHTAILRLHAGYSAAPTYFESPLSVDEVTQLIAPYLG